MTHAHVVNVCKIRRCKKILYTFAICKFQFSRPKMHSVFYSEAWLQSNWANFMSGVIVPLPHGLYQSPSSQCHAFLQQERSSTSTMVTPVMAGLCGGGVTDVCALSIKKNYFLLRHCNVFLFFFKELAHYLYKMLASQTIIHNHLWTRVCAHSETTAVCVCTREP